MAHEDITTLAQAAVLITLIITGGVCIKAWLNARYWDDSDEDDE